jgi:pyruvate dehydrogenase E2 component (dihydrolipoamide acetyltransferase)
MTPFKLPDLGEGLQSAEIVAWHVAEGEHVVADQPLLSVETEKAVVEIPSPQSGRIAQLLARPGDRVPVGAPLLVFEEGPHTDTGTVVGDLEAPKQPLADQKKTPLSAELIKTMDKIYAAPAVRARAREFGVNLTEIKPTGPSGTVTMADVMAMTVATPRKDTALRGARRTMAENMSRAWREVVHATLHDEADIEIWSAQEKVTIRLVRALIAGCKAQPMMNASFDAKTLSLNPNERIDLGLAMDSPDGLFVPILRDVANSQPADWRRQIDAFKTGVRERSLSPADFRNPTITMSNFGTMAGIHAALIIVPPQVAILGAGRISDRPVRAQNGIALHRSLPLSLTFDHRAVSGGDAARLLRAVIDDLEQAM